MSHQHNIAIARTFLEGIGGDQDPAGIAALFDADLVFEIPGDDGVLQKEHTKRKTFNQVKTDLLAKKVIGFMDNLVWFTDAKVPMSSADSGFVNSIISPAFSRLSVMAPRPAAAPTPHSTAGT
jgi:hypothetical protein